MTAPSSIAILGTRVHRVDYDSALDRVLSLASDGKPAAVSACNTHLVALARSDPAFHSVMEQFSLVVPDGYPVVWGLNFKGAGLADRVYGPYFMRHVLTHTPSPWKHFFFGGSEDCLARLVESVTQLQPEIDVVGTLSPPFAAWTEADEARFAEEIRASGADFVWVALGGGRQERWIVENMRRHSRGVFFAVGDAFELLAGGRRFAPKWMQENGLTWLYRLAQEPKRLAMRYLKYNSLFVYYSLRDAVVGTPSLGPPHAEPPTPRIAFLGSRGVPARYSGFEVVVEQLGIRLAQRGYDVTVYNRHPKFSLPEKRYKGMRIVVLPTIPMKSLDTISHTALSALHALTQGYDIIYLCGVGNAVIGGFLKLCGLRVILNVDGADFRRAKWSVFARAWLRWSEAWAGKLVDRLIADNREIVTRYKRSYDCEPLYLSYGAILRDPAATGDALREWNLESKGYILFVSRLTPENQAHVLLEAFARATTPLKLVICGGVNYEHAYLRELKALADDRVVFTGPQYGDAYLQLSRDALFFVMPADIEATRLVLLDQMGLGAAILFRDCPATREVVGDCGEPFSSDDAVASLASKIDFLASDPAHCRALGEAARARAKTHFDWEKVADDYEALFRETSRQAK